MLVPPNPYLYMHTYIGLSVNSAAAVANAHGMHVACGGGGGAAVQAARVQGARGDAAAAAPTCRAGELVRGRHGGRRCVAALCEWAVALCEWAVVVREGLCARVRARVGAAGLTPIFFVSAQMSAV